MKRSILFEFTNNAIQNPDPQKTVNLKADIINGMARSTQSFVPEADNQADPDPVPDPDSGQTTDSRANDGSNSSSNPAPQLREPAIKEDLHLDFQRGNRCGFPEAIFGEGKSADHLLEIAQQQLQQGIPVFVTRITDENAEILKRRFTARHNPIARTILIPAADRADTLLEQEKNANSERDQQLVAEKNHGVRKPVGYVPVLAAGTTDLPVVEEVIETLNWMNIGTRKIMDVGVAGPHRLPERLHELTNADAVVVVAGMEGALPSIVGGYVNCPVIAIPTSVGYGANLGGISALLSMLNSCAANVSVVNIDAGFKGAYVAGLIASKINGPTHSHSSTLADEATLDQSQPAG